MAWYYDEELQQWMDDGQRENVEPPLPPGAGPEWTWDPARQLFIKMESNGIESKMQADGVLVWSGLYDGDPTGKFNAFAGDQMVKEDDQGNLTGYTVEGPPAPPPGPGGATTGPPAPPPGFIGPPAPPTGAGPGVLPAGPNPPPGGGPVTPLPGPGGGAVPPPRNQPPPFDPNNPYAKTGYEAQDPNTAFLRYLMQQKGLPGQGTAGRGAVEDRGYQMAALAPAWGYGIDSSVQGGRGKDFAGFFDEFGLRSQPTMTEAGGRADEIINALNTEGDAIKQFQTDQGADPEMDVSKTPYKVALGAGFTDQGRQLDLVRSNLQMRMNPFFANPLGGQINRRFQTQQAMDPNTRFLDYARQQGLI